VLSLKCLGVTLSHNLAFTDHITEVICACQQSLYALRLLRAYGLKNQDIVTVFKATTLAKLIYASPAWWGFTNSNDRARLESVLRKAIKAQFYTEELPTIAELCDISDQRLFNSIISNKDHVLYKLLPGKVSHGKAMRKRTHDFTLPPKINKLDEANFLIRMLYKDIY